MLELIYWYLIVAISGGIFSVFAHYLRVRKMLIDNGNIDHQFVNHPIVSSIVWFSAVVLMLPYLVKPLLLNSYKEEFITHTFQASIAD